MYGYWVMKQGTAVDYFNTGGDALAKRDYLNSLNTVKWYTVRDEDFNIVEWPV